MPRPATRARSSLPGLLRRSVFAFAVCCGSAVLGQSPPGLGYTTAVSPALVAQYAQRFRDPARELLGRWIGFGREQKNAGPLAQRLASARGREPEVLQAVNDYFNRNVRYLEDPAHWNQVDYWATPAESVASNGGDCEDFAIAKYYMLKELGVPLERLRITYVKAIRLNQAHMVLAYYGRPDAEPLILDNLENQIRPASERTDLVPVYSFNDDEVQLAQDGRRAKPSQIRNWTNLQDRLVAERRT
jgi:predicted transglutaminase-like cysteine proteinase